MKEKSLIRPNSMSAPAVVVAALCLAISTTAIADIEEVENIPLTLKTFSIDLLKRKFPQGTRIQSRKDESGDTLVAISEENADWTFRFSPNSELLNFRIERRLIPIEKYRENVVNLIWQHGTPSYVVVPKVAGYPRGAAQACLSPSDQPGKLKLNVPCLENHLPKEPAAFASWVNDSINRLARHPDLAWTCKQSATASAKLIAAAGVPGECFVKISTDEGCSRTRTPATCQQVMEYSNVDLMREIERLARASPEILIAEGKGALERNDPDTAINRFRRAEKAMKGFSPALHELIVAAETKIQQRDWPGDRSHVAPSSQTVSQEPSRERTQENSGRLSLSTVEDKANEQRMNELLRAAAEARAFRKYEFEITALTEALEINPNAHHLLKSRQQAYENAGKPELALKDAEARAALASTDPFAQRDVARLKKQLSASRTQNRPEAATQAADSKPAHVSGQQEASRPLEALEKPYDISGLPLNAGLPVIENFLQARTRGSFKRSESDGEVWLKGKTDDGSWSVAYDTNNSTLLRAEFTSRKIPIEAKRETYTAIMRKYGMPYYLKTEYGKLLAQRTNNSGSNASPRLQEDDEKMGQCYSTCCGGGEKVKACSPHPPVNACFNDCYYPKPPQDVEALLKWLFVDEPSMAQLKILYDGVMPTYWSCARSEVGDVLRSREQRDCYVRFDINTYKTDFKYSLQFENASAIERSKERISLIQKDKEKIERERASQARTDAYRDEKAAREARYASIDEMIAKRYPYIAPERLEFLREKWRSYEDFRLWMANELKLAYWQSVPEAERETKLLEALTTNGYRPGGPNYSDAHMRSAAQDYLGFEDLRRSFDTNNTRAMIDKATADPQFASIADEKARRKAALAELHKRHPEQMKFYLGELEKVRHCYNNGSIPAGKIGGVTTYKQAPGCRGYTTTRDVNAGMAKRPNWEP